MPEQRHQAEEAGVVGGRLHRRGDLVRDRGAGRGDERDLVGLALDPRLADPQRLGRQPLDLALAAAEGGERVVDLDLRDLHRVGAVVADGQLDDPRLEHGPLDGQLLGGRAAALAEAGRAERDEQPDGDRDQRERDEAVDPLPRATLEALVAGRGAGLHQVTSKKPCQPSSVNSDWCAWNMKRPAVGKRHSRIPRWPWQSITVSVSSLGFSDVPVGM